MSGGLFVYVGDEFAAQIKIQVEAYMYAQMKSTKPRIENGHCVMCVSTFVERKQLFCHKYLKTCGLNVMRHSWFTKKLTLFQFYSHVKSQFDIDSRLPMYKMILAICHMPHCT